MPWYGFIHPVLAVLTMVYGLMTAQVSVRRLSDWNFPLRQQRTRSVVFLLLCVANLVLGLVMNIILRVRGEQVKLTAHLGLAIAVLVLALLASLISFTRSRRRPGELSGLMRLHPWLLVVAVVLIMTMGMIGLLAAFGV